MFRYLTLLLLLPFSISAQPNQEWYANNDRGNHFEGSYTRKVSNPSIHLVSLATPLPAYSFGQRQQLSVQFFSPEPKAYNLHAEELRVSQFYWLEDKNKQAKTGWNHFGGWHVDYILKRLSIDHRNLGLLIHIGRKNERQFVPARMQISEGPTTPSMYIAQIRLGRPASGGSYRLFRGKSKTRSRQILQQGISQKSSGTVFPIVIPFDVFQKQAGWYTVEINLEESRTGDPFTYSFSFYHPN